MVWIPFIIQLSRLRLWAFRSKLVSVGLVPTDARGGLFRDMVDDKADNHSAHNDTSKGKAGNNGPTSGSGNGGGDSGQIKHSSISFSVLKCWGEVSYIL